MLASAYQTTSSQCKPKKMDPKRQLPNVKNITLSYNFSTTVCLKTILELNTWLLELLATSQM
jgi:hypothetical protein